MYSPDSSVPTSDEEQGLILHVETDTHHHPHSHPAPKQYSSIKKPLLESEDSVKRLDTVNKSHQMSEAITRALFSPPFLTAIFAVAIALVRKFHFLILYSQNINVSSLFYNLFINVFFYIILLQPSTRKIPGVANCFLDESGILRPFLMSFNVLGNVVVPISCMIVGSELYRSIFMVSLFMLLLFSFSQPRILNLTVFHLLPNLASCSTTLLVQY